MCSKGTSSQKLSYLYKMAEIIYHLIPVSLTFTMLWANSADDKLIIFFLFFFPQKIDFDISCKLTHKKIVCVKF